MDDWTPRQRSQGDASWSPASRNRDGTPRVLIQSSVTTAIQEMEDQTPACSNQLLSIATKQSQCRLSSISPLSLPPIASLVFETPQLSHSSQQHFPLRVSTPDISGTSDGVSHISPANKKTARVLFPRIQESRERQTVRPRSGVSTDWLPRFSHSRMSIQETLPLLPLPIQRLDPFSSGRSIFRASTEILRSPTLRHKSHSRRGSNQRAMKAHGGKRRRLSPTSPEETFEDHCRRLIDCKDHRKIGPRYCKLLPHQWIRLLRSSKATLWARRLSTSGDVWKYQKVDRTYPKLTPLLHQLAVTRGGMSYSVDDLEVMFLRGSRTA